MDPIRKIPKKFTKKSGNKVINRQYFCRKTGLKTGRLSGDWLKFPLHIGTMVRQKHGRNLNRIGFRKLA